MIKVSVIIPAYNSEKTLQQCLNSVLSQTYENYEVVVVNNNSTDSTKEIIQAVEDKDKRISYVFESRIGRGSARNAGIEAATGEIIIMTDSDCIVPDNWIEELTRPIIYQKEKAVMGFEDDLINNFWTQNIQKANWNFIQRSVEGEYVKNLDTKNFAIDASLMKKILFDAKLMFLEDFDLALKLRNSLKIRFLSSVRVGHMHKSSFKDVVKLNINRAYWATMVFKKHNNMKLTDEIMAESISVKNFIAFPFWMVSQFFKKPWGEAFFILTSEISWRAGIVWALIR